MYIHHVPILFHFYGLKDYATLTWDYKQYHNGYFVYVCEHTFIKNKYLQSI